MKRLALSIIITVVCKILTAQVPQGLNYQALAGDASGNPIRNTNLQVKITILSDTLLPVIVWEELHSTVRTDPHGIFSLVIGSGVRQPASSVATFNEINWSASPMFIKTQIYYQSVWKNMGSAKLWTVPYAMVASNLTGNVKKLAVTGETSDMEEALFEVKNKNGQTVFAVYNEGVRIYVDDGAKGSKGGFAIGGFGTAKTPSQYLLVVNPDSIRAYIDTNSVKGSKGGFAIGGFGGAKAPGEEYLRVTRDSTRIYLNDTGTKTAKGGFAIGGFSKTKGWKNDYLSVSRDSTRVYVRQLSPEASSTFNIVAIDQNQARKSLLKANADTIDISGVLNLQNNLIVRGDINIAGTVNKDTSVISDADGNIYKKILIGTQVWMKENLRTTKYKDSTAIPLVMVNTAWAALATPGYCWYNNNVTAYKNTYGALYNWYAVNTGKLCPSGWHVPSDAEWCQLATYLDPTSNCNPGSLFTVSSLAGGYLKAVGTSIWVAPNPADNRTGFSALPAGERGGDAGVFSNLTDWTSWWTSTQINATSSYNYHVGATNVYLSKDNYRKKQYGFSVRCVKD